MAGTDTCQASDVGSCQQPAPVPQPQCLVQVGGNRSGQCGHGSAGCRAAWLLQLPKVRPLVAACNPPVLQCITVSQLAMTSYAAVASRLAAACNGCTGPGQSLVQSARPSVRLGLPCLASNVRDAHASHMAHRIPMDTDFYLMEPTRSCLPTGDRGSTDGELGGLIGATQSLVRQLSRNSSGLGLGSPQGAEQLQQQQQQQQQPVLTRLQSQASGGWLEASADRLQRGLSSEVSCPVGPCRQMHGCSTLRLPVGRPCGSQMQMLSVVWVAPCLGCSRDSPVSCRLELDAAW